MTPTDNFAADIARLAQHVQESGRSPVAILASIFEKRQITHLSLLNAIKAEFRNNPALLRTWEIYAENQRTSECWMIDQRKNRIKIWRLDDKDGVANMEFSDREYAFAMYAFLEVEWLSRYMAE